jgi:hypothetical protein
MFPHTLCAFNASLNALYGAPKGIVILPVEFKIELIVVCNFDSLNRLIIKDSEPYQRSIFVYIGC